MTAVDLVPNPAALADPAILRRFDPVGTPTEWKKIHRSVVTEIFWALADIKAGVFTILRYIEEADDGEEEAEDV